MAMGDPDIGQFLGNPLGALGGELLGQQHQHPWPNPNPLEYAQAQHMQREQERVAREVLGREMQQYRAIVLRPASVEPGSACVGLDGPAGRNGPESVDEYHCIPV